MFATLTICAIVWRSAHPFDQVRVGMDLVEVVKILERADAEQVTGPNPISGVWVPGLTVHRAGNRFAGTAYLGLAVEGRTIIGVTRLNVEPEWMRTAKDWLNRVRAALGL